jgi:hypothetical protein
MMNRQLVIGLGAIVLAGAGWVAPVLGQQVGTAAQVPVGPELPMLVTAPPPATKLEGFLPAPGAVVTVGHEEIGTIAGISVEVREIRDSTGASARGLVVDVTDSQNNGDRSFVDADEVSDLIKGMDALLEIRANPTPFKRFEVQYMTRGGLEITTFNTGRGDVLYAVHAGFGPRARRIGLSVTDIQRLRTFFQAASQKLAALPPIK